MRNKNSAQAVLTSCLLLVFSQLVFASDYSQNISEDYLRAQFVFKADYKLKYSQCKEKTYYTCTYVWGAESSKDAKRISLGLTPKGNKLQIVYAQAGSQKHFQRVITSYSDAVVVDGLGEKAVWSEKRKQLSMITGKNLIVHVHVEQTGENNSRKQAASVAKEILGKL